MSSFPIDSQKLRVLRQNKGWTQAELAEKIGGPCTDKTISRIERNRSCSLEMAGNLATALGVGIAELRAMSGKGEGGSQPGSSTTGYDLNEVVRHLDRKESVNLVVADRLDWRPLRAELKRAVSFDLPWVDLGDPVTRLIAVRGRTDAEPGKKPSTGLDGVSRGKAVVQSDRLAPAAPDPDDDPDDPA